MATNISVAHIGNSYVVTWNSDILNGNVDSVSVEFGPDDTYGNSVGGSIVDGGPPLALSAGIPDDDPGAALPFHFRCVVTQFVGDPDISDDQVYPPVNEEPIPPTPANTPLGGIAPQNDGTLGSQGFGNGSQLFSPNYISPDKFIEDRDNF